MTVGKRMNHRRPNNDRYASAADLARLEEQVESLAGVVGRLATTVERSMSSRGTQWGVIASWVGVGVLVLGGYVTIRSAPIETSLDRVRASVQVIHDRDLDEAYKDGRRDARLDVIEMHMGRQP